MGRLWQDVRYAKRMLLRAPAFTAIAVATLALGIGATTIMFAVVNGVLLRPLPYKDSDRLVYLQEAYRRNPGMSVSVPNFLDWRADNRVFSSVSAIQAAAMTLTGSGGVAQQLDGRYVSFDFLRTLGISPILGRDFSSTDDAPGAARTVMLSYGAWQRIFGGERSVLGRTITLNQQPYTVIGILPRGFVWRDTQPDVVAPLGLQFTEKWTQNRSAHAGVYAVARLKDGVTVEQAQADLDRIAARLQKDFPATNADDWVSVRSLHAFVVRNVRSALLMLMGAVALLLLIACANVANLILTRAASRRKELAIRSALGASRARLITQLLTESVILGCLGGAIGALIAVWGTRALVLSGPDALPRLQDVGVDFRVLAFALGVSVFTGIVFGMVPAWHASSSDSQTTLKEGGRDSSAGASRRLRDGLVIAELSLSFALLLGTGLLVHSFMRVMQVDPGFNPHHVLSALMIMPDLKYHDQDKASLFYDEVMRNVRAIPGVQAASSIMPLPLSGNEWDTSYWIEGDPAPTVGNTPSVEVGYFGPAYLETMQIPLLAGRTFADTDTAHSMPVVVVNEDFAKKHWPNQNPIGKHIRLSVRPGGKGEEGEDVPWREVVGVIGTVKQYGLDSPVVPQVYTPFAQPTGPGANQGTVIVVRTAADPASYGEALRIAVAKADPDQAISEVETMDQYLAASLASRQMTMALLAGFAGLALLLAAIGIYGVISYTVAQRTREIGIRMALGARREQVLGLILRGAGTVIAVSVIVGTVLSLALGRSLKSFLFGVSATDGAVFAIVIAFLAAIALLASYIPARRATKVDPMVALRYE